MPYTEITELPANVKKQYSDKAQEAFMAAFNNVLKATGDEQRSFAAAHAAARKVDGVKEVEVVSVETDHAFVEGAFHFEGEFGEGAKRNEKSGVYEIPVTLIKPGLSKNKVHYGEGWLSSFAEKMEGKKAYLDHEKKSEIKDRQSRSVKDVAGWYSGVHQSTDSSVKGVLNLVETPATEHVIRLAKANPELVGLSINARGKASRGKVNGADAMIAETVEKVYSTDIVTEAAAGGEMDMRLVASVLLDTEEIPMNEHEPTIEEQTKWYQAEWLEAERIYNEEKLMKETAEWLIAEARVKGAEEAVLTASWYEAESKYKSDVKVWLDSIMSEAAKGLPEDFELPEVDVDAKVAFIETLKKVLPEKPGKSGPADKKKPGEEGFKRNFL